MKKKVQLTITALLFLQLCGCDVLQKGIQRNPVTIIGAMRNVMWKGALQGTLSLDTIASKQHLYGLGPVEYLSGELMIWDGICYKSSVVSDSMMQVETTFQVKAPFFGYSTIEKWSEIVLPDSIQNLTHLENYIQQITQKAPRPFFFKLQGIVQNAQIHIVNLPKGTIVNAPEVAHQGLQKYFIPQQKVAILGFFSTTHQAILTHHDTYLHLHLLTDDKQKMGHLESCHFQKGQMKLYLPSL